MQNLYDLDVLLQLARERETSLQRTTLHLGDGRNGRQVRRWLGRRLVRTGTWLAGEPPMRPAGAR